MCTVYAVVRLAVLAVQNYQNAVPAGWFILKFCCGLLSVGLRQIRMRTQTNPLRYPGLLVCPAGRHHQRRISRILHFTLDVPEPQILEKVEVQGYTSCPS